MSQHNDNLRVRRTRKLLREALVDLIEERGFEALTVQEITARAMVSRAAFYRNYQDKFDLVEQIFAELMEALLRTIADTGEHHPPQVWVKSFEHIAEYERMYRALLGPDGSPWFARKMRAALLDLLGQYQRLPGWQPAPNPPGDPARGAFVAELVVTMIVEAISWWLARGRPYTPQEMANRCGSMASAMFQESGTWG